MSADFSQHAPDPAVRLTHRRVLKIAVPIVLSNATVPILGAVDTGVVGQLGEAVPIGAVGIGAIVLTTVYWIFGFLRMGTTGLTGQALGRRDMAEVAALLIRALLIGAVAGLALIALQVPIFAGAFAISLATPEVEALARDYMSIRVLSAPAAIALFGINGWLIARERTLAVLGLQLWMNGLNIVLDLVFVLGLGWGVEGVATATFLAEWTGLGLGLWLCRDVARMPRWRERSLILDPARLGQMAAVNGDIMIRSLLLQGVFVSFLMLGAGFGDVTLAANQILLHFLEIAAYAMDGFAFAAEALVSQSIGARSRAGLRRAALLTTLWGALVCTAAAAAFLLAGGALVDIMTTADAVRAEARRFLPWMVVTPLVGLAAWMLDGIFIGATRTRDMRNMMLLSTAGYAVLLALTVPVLGNHGLWVALLGSFVLRGITLGSRYPRLEADATD